MAHPFVLFANSEIGYKGSQRSIFLPRVRHMKYFQWRNWCRNDDVIPRMKCVGFGERRNFSLISRRFPPHVHQVYAAFQVSPSHSSSSGKDILAVCIGLVTKSVLRVNVWPSWWKMFIRLALAFLFTCATIRRHSLVFSPNSTLFFSSSSAHSSIASKRATFVDRPRNAIFKSLITSLVQAYNSEYPVLLVKGSPENELGISNMLFANFHQRVHQESHGSRTKSNAFVNFATGQVLPGVVRLDTDRPMYHPTPAEEDTLDKYREKIRINKSTSGIGNYLFQLWLRGNQEHVCPPKGCREKSQGTGFVLDGKEGKIITNAHVVKGAEHVKVTLTGGGVLDAKVMSLDEVSDLALVQVATKGEVLPSVPLGDSDTVEIGDWVIAIGNPYGLQNTISLGIISNLQRTATEVGLPSKRMVLFQTDCAINPGSSGGPLVNEFGEVIGINTAIRADADGIAFAIPINNVMRIVKVLEQGQCAQHPCLGIEVATLQTKHLSTCYDASTISEFEGVVVMKVSNNSPAADTGLRTGDIIVGVDGKPILSGSQLQKLVQTSSFGQVLYLRLWREGKYLELSVKTTCKGCHYEPSSQLSEA